MKDQDSRKDRPKSCNITISPVCRRSRAPRRAPMPRSSNHSPLSEAPRPSAKVCKSRLIESVSVPEIPKGPPSHDPRDIHRFSRFQNCPQRSPSHDLSGLSAFQRFQKGPQATILETFIVFSKFQDCPQRFPSHDLSSLSVLQSFQKGPEATILKTFIVFRKSKIVPRGPQVTIYRPCQRFRASRRGMRELCGRVSRA